MATYAELREKYVNGQGKEQQAKKREAPDNAKIVEAVRQYTAQHQAENAGKWAAWQEAATAWQEVATARDNASAAARAAEEAQKKYDEYLLTDEAQSHMRQNQAAKGAQMMQGAGISTSYAAGMQQQYKIEEDELEKQLRAKRDYYQQQAQQAETKRIMKEDLAEFEKWPEEDRLKLQISIENGAGSINSMLGAATGKATAQAFVAQNELEEKYGAEIVDRMMRSVSRSKNEKIAGEVAALGKQTGEDHAALGSVATVPMKLIGDISAPLGYLSEAVRGGKGQYPTLDPNNLGNLPNAYSVAVRGQVAKNISGDEYDEQGNQIKEGGALRQGGAYLYQGVMSLADSIARATVGGGAAGGAALAASGSFSQAISDASAAGATPTQAVLLGVATAGMEYLTEKIPMDEVFKVAKSGNTNVLKQMFKQAGVEITTEELSLFGTLAAEAAIMQEQSSYKQQIAEAMANGASYAEAKKIADDAIWEQVKETAIVSGISGSISGGGSAVVGNVFNGNTQPDTQTPTQTEVTAEAAAAPVEQAEQVEATAQPQQEETATEATQMPKERQAAQDVADMLMGKEKPAQPEEAVREQTQDAEQNAVAEPEMDGVQEPEMPPAEVTRNLWQRKRGERDEDYRVTDGWQAVTDNSVWATALAMNEVNPEYFNAYMAAADSEQLSPLIDAVINAANDVRQESISPMAAATVINEAYQKNGEAGLRNLYNRAGNLYENVLQQMRDVDAEHSNVGIKGTGAAEQNFSGKAQYQDLLTDDNVQRQRPDDVRDVEVPKKDAYDRNVSEFVGNAVGAEITSDNMVNTIEELVQEGALGFDKRSNQDALNDAAKEIETRGAYSVRSQITNNIANGKIKDGDIEKAMLLYAKFANRDSKQAIDNASELMVDLATMAHMTGRNLQLFKLLRKLTPEGQVMTVRKMVTKNVDSMIRSGKVDGSQRPELNEQLLDEYKKAAAENARAVSAEQKQTSEAKMQELQQAIMADAASQLKCTFKAKWDAWRYMAMLGSGRTQIRNIVGNALFVPYKAAKDSIGAAFELALPKEQRTKSIVTDPKLMQWASQDAKTSAVQDALKYTGKLGDNATDAKFSEQIKVFDSKILESTRKIVEALPQKGDMLFKNGYYASSLAGFLNARGYNLSDIESGNISDAVMAEARGYAINEAMKATFNDCNAFSDAISSIGRKETDNPWGKVLNYAAESVLPFRRTPANILVRFTEYSPAGILKGAWDMADKVSSGKLSAASAVDQLASGLAGSGALMLGYFMAKGIGGIKLTGGGTDEDEKRQGHQNYAIEFSINGREYSYTIDWAAPANLPLFVGANLYNAMEGNGADTSISALSRIWQAAKVTFEPMLQLSCLSSLNDLVEGIRYAPEGEALYSIAADIATGYLTQGIPALARQTYQASKANKQTTFANDPDPTIRELQKIGAQIPFVADNFQTDKRNAWGETETVESGAIRAINAFLNPGTAKEIDNSAIEQEITRLNDAQTVNVTPPTVEKKISYTDRNGEEHKNQRLTEEQYQKLAQTQGQTAKKILDELVQAKGYQNMTDAEKANTIKAVYEYAAEKGKRAALGKEYYSNADAWIGKVKDGDLNAFMLQGSKKVLNNVVDNVVTNLTQNWEVSEAAKDDLEASWQTFDKMSKSNQDKLLEAVTGDTARYLLARQDNVSAESWMAVTDSIKSLKPEKGEDNVSASQEYAAIANAKNVSEKEKDALMRAYMPDYDPENGKTKQTEIKYDYMRQVMELSPAKAVAALRISGESGKKDEKKKRWSKLGLSPAQADTLWNLLESSSEKEKIDVVAWSKSRKK